MERFARARILADSRSARIVLAAALAAALFAAGWFARAGFRGTDAGEPEIFSVRQNSSEFKYINPLLFVDNSKEDFSEYQPLEKRMREYIADAEKAGTASKVSVYFRDLNTSRWGGINEREPYAPSSMLKVAVLVGYLKWAEKDPDILSKEIRLAHKDSYGEYYKPENELPDGAYSVRELLLHMIIDSDNSSMSALVAENAERIASVYRDLQLPDIVEGPDDFMSAESYSYIFRTLYNATYLRRTYSEEALRLLTQTGFDRGIVQGVGSTSVAHKFGEHTITTNGKASERQLHDCGIVYYPGKPYLLCIMTKGAEFVELERIIADLSAMAFSFAKDPGSF